MRMYRCHLFSLFRMIWISLLFRIKTGVIRLPFIPACSCLVVLFLLPSFFSPPVTMFYVAESFPSSLYDEFCSDVLTWIPRPAFVEPWSWTDLYFSCSLFKKNGHTDCLVLSAWGRNVRYTVRSNLDANQIGSITGLRVCEGSCWCCNLD